MTTIIRDRTMLSDRITKWARRCFQNRYDCRGSRRSADAAPKMPAIIIEIRCRVNSDDFETMIEARLRLSINRFDYLKDLKINAKCAPRSLPTYLLFSLLSPFSLFLCCYILFRYISFLCLVLNTLYFIFYYMYISVCFSLYYFSAMLVCFYVIVSMSNVLQKIHPRIFNK